MNRNGKNLRHFRHGLLIGILCTTTLQAQSPALEQAKVARAIAEQKLADDIERAINEAKNLAVISVTKATERLRQTQNTLDLNVTVSTETRRAMELKIQTALALMEGKSPPAQTMLDPKTALIKESEKQLREKASREAAEVSNGIAKVAEYAEAGNLEAARRHAESLTAKFPNNPQLIGLAGQRLTADLLRQRRQDAREYELAWLGTMRETEMAAVPIAGEIQFPNAKKWQDLTERRRKADRIQLTAKEESILKALDTQIPALFNERPFEEALQELSNQIDQPIYIDRKSLEDLGIELNRRVSFKGRVSVRTALRALLQTNGLTFVVKDEMIQVVALEKADREMLSTRSYYLGDVIQGVGPYGNAVIWGPQIGYQQTLENAQVIVKMIKDQVDPRCWKDMGGPCTITFHLPTMSIVVRGSTEVHASLGGIMSGGK